LEEFAALVRAYQELAALGRADRAETDRLEVRALELEV